MNERVAKLKKPHELAFVGALPCHRCNSPWQRPAVVFVEDAEELPIVNLCAHCGAMPLAMQPAPAPGETRHE